MEHPKPHRIWTLAEAKARLSEILRLAETQGPQYIGSDPAFVLTLVHTEQTGEPERLPLGKWLVQNTPRGLNLEIPRDRVHIGPTLLRSTMMMETRVPPRPSDDRPAP